MGAGDAFLRIKNLFLSYCQIVILSNCHIVILSYCSCHISGPIDQDGFLSYCHIVILFLSYCSCHISGSIDQDGLNPNRQRGFGVSGMGSKVETQHKRIGTSSLNEMKAKQGAIVARFMTFSQRKSSLVVEMYNGAFYKHKPTWDKIADFIFNDLCATADHRKAIQDVQFHPVKMLIFVKCIDNQMRDIIVSRLRSYRLIIPIWKLNGFLGF